MPQPVGRSRTSNRPARAPDPDREIEVRKRPVRRQQSATIGVRIAMELDRQVCSRARLARDARFDGKFFIGVLTTGIYCRPVCRTRASKESNVRYFPTA